MPAIHSSWLSLVSRAKSCRWVTSLSKMYLRRGSGHWALILCVFSVMLSTVRSINLGILTCEGSMLELIGSTAQRYERDQPQELAQEVPISGLQRQDE